MPKDRFYLHIALVMTGVVFVGFGPSYYWKPVIDSPALPTVWVGLHALACSLWMLLLVVQAGFVAKGRTDLHRKLGVTGLVLIPVIVALGYYIALEFVRHNHDLLVVERSDAHRFFLSGSLVGITFFAALGGAALALRKRTGFHKRLIVFATLVLISASFARLPLLGPLGPPWTGIPMWAALIWIIIHDKKTEGRVHKATWVGVALILLYAVLVVVMSVSPALDIIAGWLTA
jgi:hypothetical protein